MTRTVLLAALALAAALSPGAAADGERLAYEIVVTNPGTRSQGWNGKLFGPDGKARAVPVSERVETPVGAFVSVACRELWVPCGMIHEKTLKWMEIDPGNAILDGEAWSYRLYVSAEGSKSEGWRGEILHAGAAVEAGGKPADTPMGSFDWRESPHAWGWHGWFHAAWAN